MKVVEEDTFDIFEADVSTFGSAYSDTWLPFLFQTGELENSCTLSIDMLLSLPELCTLDSEPFSVVLIKPLDFWYLGSRDLEDILEVRFGTSGGTFLQFRLFLEERMLPDVFGEL